MAGLVAAGCTVPLRLGNHQDISVTGTSLLLAVLPPGWVLLCVAGGVLAVKFAIRRPLVKAAYTAAKDTVAAAAA